MWSITNLYIDSAILTEDKTKDKILVRFRPGSRLADQYETWYAKSVPLNVTITPEAVR